MTIETEFDEYLENTEIKEDFLSLDLNQKLNKYFPGKVVRKDLTKSLREGINVPVYVLEYLLGMYCSSDDESVIKTGIQRVKQVLSDNYVRPDEAEKIKSKIKEKGRYKIIDKVTVKLNEKENRYEALISNINLKNVIVNEMYVRNFEKLLAGGIWCILNIDYFYDENSKESPFHIVDLKPIQMPNMDMQELFTSRENFETQEWIDVLIRSIGMEPANFPENAKWHLLARMIPFVENNFNVCELGPRGTGKSYVYDEISPNSILISGGQTTVANLFYNMASRTIGLVGLWDVVAFDEVAGIRFKDKDGIQIMKGYMANGAFARGKEHVNATASMVFVGNIDGSIQNIVKTSHLLSPFPKEMIDSAFFDRFHYYIPGWEIPKMKPDFFTDQYGFISDYLAEWMRELRKHTFLDAIEKHFKLGSDLATRDVTAVKKTVSGLLKLLYPHGKFNKEEVRVCLEYALVGRRRVKEQLKKIGGMEFYQVHFSYIDLEDKQEKFIGVPESGGTSLIPEGNLSPGSLYTIATSTAGGQKGLFRIDVQIMPGTGKFSDTGFGSGTAIKEEMKEAINYLKANLSKISPNLKYSEFDFHIKATDMNGIGNISGMELAIFISLVSSILEKPVLSQSAILGSMSIGGTVLGTQNLGDALQVASDSGAKKVMIPVVDMIHMAAVPPDLFTKFNLIIYNDPINAVFKALGVE